MRQGPGVQIIQLQVSFRMLDIAGTSVGNAPISRYATFNSRTDNCLLSNIGTPVQNVGHFIFMHELRLTPVKYDYFPGNGVRFQLGCL